ncbi:MAG: Nif3-like dinuclear metal center hexameric protein [Deltaproteobacteria bacterium]|nr:Nif3-like dinuclear metal center hexameric protein [Deltaproteobacteria bacterium]
MQLCKILEILDQIAPFETAAEWDNVGLMVGDPAWDIGSILVALDPSQEVIASAGSASIDLILTHHPLFFQGVSHINLSEVIGQKVAMLLETHTALVSMHTNLDKSPGGVADTLSTFLRLEEVQTSGMLRYGTIGSSLPLDEWVASLPAGNARIVDAGRDVLRVCACPGSGAEFWREAMRQGCDTFVTGDVRYHTALDARESGLNIVDLGHFGSEAIIVQPLADRLRKVFPELEIHIFEGSDIFINLTSKESED